MQCQFSQRRPLIEIVPMQHKLNSNKKYTVKFYSSAVIKEETSVTVVRCLFAQV